MIRKAIPVLVHEDCMDSISEGLAKQEVNISKIAENTQGAKNTLENVDSRLVDISADMINVVTNTSSIKTSSSNTATATSSINSSVGTTSDASTSNTVIGLLKSIANKL